MSYGSLGGRRCIGMVRTSTGDQTEASIPQQTKLLQDFAIEQGMQWVDVEAVDGISGSTPGARDDISKLIARRQKLKDFDTILVQDRSRFTRSGQEYASWLTFEFARHGVKIVSITSPTKPGDRYAWVIDGLEDEAAQSYVRRLSHDTCRGRQAKLEAGDLAYANTPPFGIDRLYRNADGVPMHIIRVLRDGRQERRHHSDGTVLETYPANQKGLASRHWRKGKTDLVDLVPGDESLFEPIRLIMHRHYKLNWGYHRIANSLHEDGHLSPTGVRWNSASVEQVVHATIYTGYGISNMYATGKFHLRDRKKPKEVAYDATELLNVKEKRRTIRPPEDWLIREYPALKVIIPDDAFRKLIYQRQYDWHVRRYHRLLGAPRRDRHVESRYFLKHVLCDHETKKGLIGRKGGRGNHYYFLSEGRNKYDTDKAHLARAVPAEPVEAAARALLAETLATNANLDRLIREVVIAEAKALDHSHAEIAVAEKEEKRIDAQIGFAVKNLMDLGEQAVADILGPLKEQRLAIQRRLQTLRDKEDRPKINIEKTISTLRTQLLDVSAAITAENTPFQLLRSLFTAFTRMSIHMDTFDIDVEVGLPPWAVEHANQIEEAVGTLVPLSAMWSNKANLPKNNPIAHYRCGIRKLGQSRHKPTCACRRIHPASKPAFGNAEAA